jgi:hypothetical protein
VQITNQAGTVVRRGQVAGSNQEQRVGERAQQVLGDRPGLRPRLVQLVDHDHQVPAAAGDRVHQPGRERARVVLG